MKRVNIKAILDNPETRRELIVLSIMAAQEHEGRDRNRKLAEAAYDRVIRTIVVVICACLLAAPVHALDTRAYYQVGGMGLTESGISEGHKSYHLIGLGLSKDEFSLSLEGFFRGEPADEDPELLQLGAAGELRYTQDYGWAKPYLGVSYNHWSRDESDPDLIYFAAAHGGARFRWKMLYLDAGTIVPFWVNTQSGNFGLDLGAGFTWGALDIGCRYKSVVLSDHHFQRGDNDKVFTFSGLEIGWRF